MGLGPALGRFSEDVTGRREQSSDLNAGGTVMTSWLARSVLCMGVNERT